MSDTLQILYGAEKFYADVTEQALYLCKRDGNSILLPATEGERADILGDPLYGTLKHLLVKVEGTETRYPAGVPARIFLTKSQEDKRHIGDPHLKLKEIHEKIKLVKGEMKDEYPEQQMAVSFIRPENRVLELGANIGRNTLTIASLLSDSRNLLTMETDPESASQLEQNRDLNGFKFQIVNAALSKKKLFQKEWDTIQTDSAPDPSFYPVNIISYQDLVARSQCGSFDVLVADCEGALYYIFQDFPELLDAVKTIIMENDYGYKMHKDKVNLMMINKGFKRVYNKYGGWGPCAECFFEVWKK